jgi:hypothetical protein
MKTYFTTCLLFFLVNFSFGATISSIGDGSWEDPSSWDLGRVPQNGDIIVIQSGHTIEILTNNVTCNDAPATHVYILGELRFDNGAKLWLGCGSSITVEVGGIIEDAGGGGSSKKTYICNSEVWNSGDGDVPGFFTFGTPLPIELTDFTAMVQSGHVFLEWTTNSEENNNYFEILRSRNGLSYEAIGQIDGAGTTNNQSRYSFDDTAPYEGVSYYKLKQTDFDGKSEMFSPIAVDLYTLEDGSCILTVYPNPCPVNCYAKLTECKLGEAQIQLMMTDATGHIVHEVYDTRNFDGSFDIKLDKTNNLKPGIYIVLAKTGKETFSEKVLLTE